MSSDKQREFFEKRLSDLIGTITQDYFTNPYTEIKYVDEYIEDNTFDKLTTQSDVIDMVNDIDDIIELKETLKKYFRLDEY